MTTLSSDGGSGYGQPPVNSRWPKGKSGNPRGRPRRKENALEIVDRLLLSPVNVTFNGEPKRVTALEAIISQLQTKEFTGNARASRILLAYREVASEHADKEVHVVYIEQDDSDGREDL